MLGPQKRGVERREEIHPTTSSLIGLGRDPHFRAQLITLILRGLPEKPAPTGSSQGLSHLSGPTNKIVLI